MGAHGMSVVLDPGQIMTGPSLAEADSAVCEHVGDAGVRQDANTDGRERQPRWKIPPVNRHAPTLALPARPFAE